MHLGKSDAGSGPAATLINASSDSNQTANVEIDSSSSSGVRFLNFLGSGFSLPGNDYIRVTSGTAQFYGLMLWATRDATKGISVSGANSSVVLEGGTMTNGVATLTGGTTNLSGVYFQQGPNQVTIAATITACTPACTHIDGNMCRTSFGVTNNAGGLATVLKTI